MGIHRAQAFAIPFENLDIHWGRPIRIDSESVFNKLVRSSRGGYCYELNGLLSMALRSMGFEVRTMAARNIRSGEPYRQKSHQLLEVMLNGRPWIADLGFGGMGLIEAAPFEIGTEFEQGIDRFRFVEDPQFGYALQTWFDGAWVGLYGFTLETYYRLDFEMMNYFNSNHPESTFLQRRMAALPSAEGRTTLAGNELRIRTRAGVQCIEVPEGETPKVLWERFGIETPSTVSDSRRIL